MTITSTDLGASRPIGDAERLVTSRSTMVAIAVEGAILPATTTGAPVMRLDLLDLEVLAHLSNGAGTASEVASALAGRAGSTTEDVEASVRRLVDRGAVVAVDGARTYPWAEAGSPTPLPDPAGSAVVDGPEVFAVPTVFRIAGGQFEHRSHDGSPVVALDPTGMAVATAWREPRTAEEAFARLGSELPGGDVDRRAFDCVSALLREADLLQRFDPELHDNGVNAASADEAREQMRRHLRVMNATRKAVEQHAAEVDDRGGPARVPVVPIHDSWLLPPLSLGAIVAHAKAHRGGELERSYAFVPRWLIQPAKVTEAVDRPSVILFSNYVWNTPLNLEMGARLKAVSPESVAVHGGPNTPKYEGDVHRFFADHPHVDVTVRGEGEVTFTEMLEALVGCIGDGPPDLSPLEDVKGLSFRLGDRIVTTPDRDRIADLDTIPSPYLTGLFDAFTAGPGHGMKLETNRGCPYGCTFCDWGSATNSRIRKFDLDRIFAEIEWAGRNKLDVISICDANFGIFERDVAIAEKIAEVRRTYGYPNTIGNNYAKNTVKHLKDIIRIFADAGIIAEGTVSLQSMDPGTLQVIRRKNIKVEKYTELAAEFTENHLPLAVDLMMALPGSTVSSFKADMQACADRDVRVRIHPTILLANSPMNEPSYRVEHGISALPGQVVKRTNTFDEDDWQYMWELRHVYLLCDLFAILRQVARYVRAETGVKEVEFYDGLMRDAFADPERWPTIAFTLRSIQDLMVPPCSWSLFLEEVGEYVTSVHGVADDDALATVLSAQHLLLPSRDRRFPESIETAHDIAAWHRARLEACDAGHLEDWEQRIPSLRSFGPGTLTVDDPEDVCRHLGLNMTMLSIRLLGWDLDSAIARPRSAYRPRDAGEGDRDGGVVSPATTGARPTPAPTA